MNAIVEIIVAHYNGSNYVGEQIDSIQKNILPPGLELRLSVIDDGSRIEEYEKLLVTCSRWSNVKVIRNEPNLGVIRTFEKGLKLSTAPYVMLCDQDDVWLTDKIRLSFEKMREIEDDSPAMVFTNLRTVDQKLNTLRERMLDFDRFDSTLEKHQLLFRNLVTGCTVMLNRKLIEIVLPFPPVVPMHDHWLAICAAFAGKLGFVSQPTILYRQHSANLVGQPKRELSARAKKPFATFTQFNKGLAQKAGQTHELSKRLPEGADKAFTEAVAQAFKKNSPRDLRFLIRTRVFDADWISLPLICALYLIPSRTRHAPQ